MGLRARRKSVVVFIAALTLEKVIKVELGMQTTFNGNGVIPLAGQGVVCIKEKDGVGDGIGKGLCLYAVRGTNF